MTNATPFDLAAWHSAVALSPLSAKAVVIGIRLGVLATNGVLQSHSREWIAQSLKANLRTFDKTVQVLEALGFLAVVRREGRGHSNRYELKMPNVDDREPGAQEIPRPSQSVEDLPADSLSQPEQGSWAKAKIATLGKIVDEGGVCGIELGDEDIDGALIAALLPAVEARFKSDGARILARLPAGYLTALAVMNGKGILREDHIAAARRIAHECLATETASPNNTV